MRFMRYAGTPLVTIALVALVFAAAFMTCQAPMHVAVMRSGTDCSIGSHTGSGDALAQAPSVPVAATVVSIVPAPASFASVACARTASIVPPPGQDDPLHGRLLI